MSDLAPTTATDEQSLPQVAVMKLVPFLFSSLGTEQRTRRPIDVVGLVIAVGVITAAAIDDSAALAIGLPDWIDTAASIVFFAAGLYAAVIVVLSILAGDRAALVRDLLVAGGLTLLAGVVLGRVVQGEWPDVLLPVTEGDRFPVLRLSILTAVMVTGTPHLIRPARRLGWVLVVGAGVSAYLLELGPSSDMVAAVAVGYTAATLVHLVWGSPVGAPPPSRVAHALAGMGVTVTAMEADPVRRRGVATFDVTDDGGRRLRTKVYGRDASDTRLAVNAWRLIWYRDRRARLTLTRREQAEHEALVTILAGRAGAPTPEVVAAGSSPRGDAFIATTWPPGVLDAGTVTDAHVRDLWHLVGVLADAHIAHSDIDPDHVRLDRDGSIVLVDWDDATAGAGDDRLLIDGASVLVTTALLVGVERAVAAATEALPEERLQQLLSLLQPAALLTGLRRHVKAADLDLGDLRKAVSEAIGEEPPQLAKLRRVTIGRVLTLALGIFVITLLVSSLADIGLEALIDAFSSASWEWLLLALVIGQTPRFSQAFSTIGASPKALPLAPTYLLQVALTFINLVIPNTAGRVATTVRYQQRFGVPTTDAVIVGALDSFCGFLVQAVILIACFPLGLSDLELTLGEADPGSLATILGWILVIGLLLAAGSLLIGRVRRLALDILRRAIDGFKRLRSPQAALYVFGGNLGAEVLYAVTLGIVAQAYGYDISLIDLMAINVSVSLLSGLMPVPGGVGVAEGALAAGLASAGVPDSIALAAALSYRAITYYLPPIWGAVALRWLRRREYLDLHRVRFTPSG